MRLVAVADRLLETSVFGLVLAEGPLMERRIRGARTALNPVRAALDIHSPGQMPHALIETKPWRALE